MSGIRPALPPSKDPPRRTQHAHDPVPSADAEEPDASSSAWKFFVGLLVVLLIMVAIIFWQKHKIAAEQEANRYNGFDFAQAQGGIWVTRLDVGGQPYDIPFYFHPKETLTVGVHRDAPDVLLKARPREVVISVPPDGGAKVVVAAVEISRITGDKYNLLNLPTRSALSRPTDDVRLDVPVMACANATAERVIIEFVQGRQNAVIREGNCVKLVYTDVNESVRVADRYAYMLVGIMG